MAVLRDNGFGGLRISIRFGLRPRNSEKSFPCVASPAAPTSGGLPNPGNEQEHSSGHEKEHSTGHEKEHSTGNEKETSTDAETSEREHSAGHDQEHSTEIKLTERTTRNNFQMTSNK